MARVIVARPDQLTGLIAPLRDAPSESAALFDVDGTLAPIVDRPGDAVVPEETRDALRGLARTFALVGCISGRRAEEARRLVGLEELTYAGNHGLELLRPGDACASLDPAIAETALAAREFVHQGGAEAASEGGLRLEDKGPIQALHWRGAPDEREAERRAHELAERARRAGLETRWGRKVLELRPAADVDKGTAVRRLLDRPELQLALFAGDDRTDLDAFRALRALAEGGELRASVCIGVYSDEAPAELAEQADAVVTSPADLTHVLRALAAPRPHGDDRAGS